MFKSAKQVMFLLSVFLFLVSAQIAYGAPPTLVMPPTVNYIPSSPAIVGSQIEIRLQFNSNVTGNIVRAYLDGIANPSIQNLGITQLSGTLHEAVGRVTITDGSVNYNNTPSTYNIGVYNDDGAVIPIPQVQIRVDSERPNITSFQVLQIVRDGQTIPGPTANIQGEDQVTLRLVTERNDTDGVQLDLSPLNLGNNVQMTGPGVNWTYVFNVPNNITRTFAINAILRDIAGNTRTFTGNNTLNLTVTPKDNSAPPVLTDGPTITYNPDPAITNSQFTVTLTFTSNLPNPTARFQTNGISNNPIQNLNITNLGNNSYSATGNITVTAGNINYAGTGDETACQILLTNATGTTTVNTTVKVDNKAPQRDGIMTATITRNGTVIPGNNIISGDQVRLVQNTIDNDTNNITVDLSAAGLGTVTMTRDSNTSYSYEFTVPQNQTANIVLNTTITDMSGQATSYTGADALTLNTTPLSGFMNVSVTSNPPPPAPATPGDQLIFTAIVNNYNPNNTVVRVTSSELTTNHGGTFSNLPLTLTVVNQSGTTATLQATLTLPTDQDVYYNNNLVFRFTAMLYGFIPVNQDATFAGILDLGNFQHRTSHVVIHPGNNPGATANIATATSILEFISDISATAGNAASNTITVTADLTPIGIAAPLTLTYDSARNIWAGNHTGINTPIDEQYISFNVTATDRYGNVITRQTTPPILIDNVAPSIESFTITGASGSDGSIINGDRINIQAVVASATALTDAVTINLTTLDNSGVHNLTNTAGNNWQYRHNVGLGSIDEEYNFILIAKDRGGNTSTTNLSLAVDNQPPVYIGQSINITVQQNPPYVIIGDSVSVSLELNNNADVGGVTLDLSALGNLGVENMNQSGNTYAYDFDIATGPINRGATFTVSIVDDAGNGLIDTSNNPIVASFSFPTLDQNPPDPMEPIMTITNRAPGNDNYPNSINSWKTVTFRLPFTPESGYEDSATSSVKITPLNKPLDLTYLNEGTLYHQFLPVGITSNFVNMNKSGNVYSVVVIATETFGLGDENDYQFDIIMTDKSGNRALQQTEIVQKIDLEPPVISSITATHNGGAVVKIGDNITFTATVTGNDGFAPKINIRNLNPTDTTLTQALMFEETPGSGIYTRTITVATGTLNSILASWSIIVYDGCDNFAASYTREIEVDNLPPAINSFTVTSTSITNNNRINYSDTAVATFSINSTETLGEVYLDLSAIGVNTAIAIADMNVIGNLYTYALLPREHNETFTNYKFTAIISDVNGNNLIIKTNGNVGIVDCEVPTFVPALCGAEISGRNPNMPPATNPNIARVGDSITVYASMTAAINATAAVTLGINPGVASLTRQMTYNSAKNRVEAVFVIEAENTNSWASLNQSLAYSLNATDNAANIATTTNGITSFIVQNKKAELASYSFTIFPDIAAPVGILNIASATIAQNRDGLVASATLSNNNKISKAYLDLSNFGGPVAIELASITNSVVSNEGNSLDIAALCLVDNTEDNLRLTIYDEAGYVCQASQKMRIDTKAPEITKVLFDGEHLKISFSETVEAVNNLNNINKANWNIKCLSGDGTPLTFPLTNCTWNDLFDDYEITLTNEILTSLVSAPADQIYLEVLSVSTSATTDLCGNWVQAYSDFPVTVTSYTWQDPPEILSFKMTHNWPTNITFLITFTQEMLPSSFVASEGVLFVDDPGVSDFNDVSYDSWYVFQKDDIFTWTPDNERLQIKLCDKGRDWIAANLTNDNGKSLKFAQYYGKRMVKSKFDKELKQYSIANPCQVTDNRQTSPIAALNIKSSPKPIINLASATLTLHFTDRARLFFDDFGTESEIDPAMAMPVLTAANSSKTHIGNISLFNLQNNESIQLTCKEISASKNQFASTSVIIDLTNEDLSNILEFYKNNNLISWGLQVNADSFSNLWGMGNTQYKPNTPGTMNFIEPAATTQARLAACAVSDMPPTKDDVGNFVFDFELIQPIAGALTLPFSTASPNAAIFEYSTGDRIASATFVSWSNRTVMGEERIVAKFKTSENFLKNVNSVEAELRLYNLKDLFGTAISPMIASFVYDITKKSSTTTTGFTTASQAFIIDNVIPTVTNASPLLIGITPSGNSGFYIEFSEPMAENTIPSLTLATDAAVIGFTFQGWEAGNTRALFSINQSITESTPNGDWNYNISGGEDRAGNQIVPTLISVKVKSEIPNINAGSMNLYTKIKTISENEIVENKPLNLYNSPDYIEVRFTYETADTDNLPHRAYIYNAANQLIASAPVVQTGVNAVVPLSISDFIPSLIPTDNTNLSVRIVDMAGNQTASIGTIAYYAKGPSMANMSLTGVATYSGGVYYYTTELDDMAFQGRYISASGNLTLLIASYSIPMSPVATTTVSLMQSYQNLSASFGKNLDENIYYLMIADEAGNLHTGLPPIILVVDDSKPNVTNITPGPSDIIAYTPIGGATFTVSFSEPMDTTLIPTLDLATLTYGIGMQFVGWGSDMMTASFTNTTIIDSLVPIGFYKYSLSNAQDLSGNIISPTPSSCITYIQPKGPGLENFETLSLQPDISDNTLLINRSYNPVKYNTGDAASVTFRLTYKNPPTDNPHLLHIYDSGDNEVAVLPVTLTAPKVGVSTWNSSNILAASLGNNAVYSFKISDSLNNFAPETGYLDQKFYVDVTAPVVSQLNFTDNNVGQIVGGIKYFSPTNGLATISATTAETGDLVLIVASSTAATATYLLPASTSHLISFGEDYRAGKDGGYLLSLADSAGNLCNDAGATMTILIDNIKPEINLATAVDEYNNPVGLIGKEGAFLVVFDSIMNTTATFTALIATDTNAGTTETATLTWAGWVDNITAKFTTNGAFNGDWYPAGFSNIVLSGARDLAGNLAIQGLPLPIVEVISMGPDCMAVLHTRQGLIDDPSVSDDDLPTNRIFSLNTEPNIATLTITYPPLSNAPYALPHELWVYDGTGTNVASHANAITALTNGKADITINSSFFGNSFDPSTNFASFTIRLKDSAGNMGAPASYATNLATSNLFTIYYDGYTTAVTDFNTQGISTASSNLVYYYNPDISGNLSTNITLAGSDTARLIVYGVASIPYGIIATRTYDMALTDLNKYSYQGNLSDSYGTALPEGSYSIAVADKAGNVHPRLTNLLIDKTSPEVLVATITNATYISSGDAGMATFTVKFNESLFESAYQYLEIATTSYQIPCRFVRLTTTDIASDTAVFETAVAIPNSIVQGQYVYHVIGTDLAGNRTTTDTGSIFVKSAGPVVSSIKTYSYQSTTASATLGSGNEFHYDEMFSMNVPPSAATMSIRLQEAPDGDPSQVYVTFLKAVTENQMTKEIIVASHSVSLVSLNATFTWDASLAPSVATEATYIVRIADVNNDLSFYSYDWTVDNVIPTYSNISFTGGVNFPASGTVYLNPYRHTNFEVHFTNLKDHQPRLRVRNGISTDSYLLAPLNNNTWKTPFRGKYSRPTNNPEELMPDGIYDLGLTDKAGNLAASGTEDLYQLILDTKSPIINSFNLTINGSDASSYCAPSQTTPLVVSLVTSEPLTATGAYFLDIYNQGEIRINRLNLVMNGSTIEGYWNGTNSSNAIVPDGKYIFRVSDLCGNSSIASATTTAVTSPFQAMGAEQISSDTIRVWLNHKIDPSSLNSSSITSNPSLTVSDIQIFDERALTFKLRTMTHGVTYTLAIDNSLKNIYGSSITTGLNSSAFTADVKGPAIVGTSFELVNGQNEVMIIFDQPIDRTTAEATGSYLITDSRGRIVSLTTAILQGDNSSVMLCASSSFIENADYLIRALGVCDELGNGPSESSITGFAFKGRDITPPQFVISAFSNAANEHDIIVVVIASEELQSEPTLTIRHGISSTQTLTMQKNSTNSLAYMAAASLQTTNGTTGTLSVTGTDVNGNTGSNNGSFVLATVSKSSNIRLSTADNQFTLIFDENSLKADSTVKILQRAVIKDENATGTIQTALQNEFASIRGVRASVTNAEEEASNSELTPLTDAYEAALISSKVNQGVIVAMKVPETASQTKGIGLFYQKNGGWNYISSHITSDKEIKARITSSQVFAIMQDSVAPSIKFDNAIDFREAFNSARPEFTGFIKDAGSGIDSASLEVKIDDKAQSISLANDGSFKFRPLSELTNGSHNMAITAKDRTGNVATTGSLRFALVLPFEFKQIIQYPNPARNYTTIRIRTNSTGVNCHIGMKIYDVAGHKVADFDETDVTDKGDGSYEIRWDLCNKKGKKVANGVYIARIEAVNPETGKKIKKSLKIAVLR